MRSLYIECVCNSFLHLLFKTFFSLINIWRDTLEIPAEHHVGLPAERALKIAASEQHIEVADHIFAKIPNIKLIGNSFGDSRAMRMDRQQLPKSFREVANETKRRVIFKVFKPGTMPKNTELETLGDLLEPSEVSNGDTNS